jgi:hypothetical protein
MNDYTNDRFLAWEKEQAKLDYCIECMKKLLANMEAERNKLADVVSVHRQLAAYAEMYGPLMD